MSNPGTPDRLAPAPRSLASVSLSLAAAVGGMATSAAKTQNPVVSDATSATPVEYGRIAWQRDFDAAAAAAKASDRPLLVLFQEVPG